MENKTINYKIHGALIIAVFFWAISFIATKVSLESLPPLFVVFVRLAVSSVCFLIWMYLKKERFSFKGGRWLFNMIILSLFGSGLHYSLQTIGLQYTTASNASLYAVTAPLTITAIAIVFLGEKLSLKKIIGILLALFGVLTVIGFDTILNFNLKGHLLGDILVFASISMWGIFTVLGKKMTEQIDALNLTMIITIIGTVYMAPIGFYDLYKSSILLTDVPTKAWLAVLFLGITCSFLATLLYFFALQHSESQKVGVYLYAIPPMTQIFAAVFLSEIIGFTLIIGSIAVLFGVYLTEKG
jgi:drug/metabolite transporter (DMT)-like permease